MCAGVPLIGIDKDRRRWEGDPFMRSKVAFEGYEPMSIEDQSKYRDLAEIDTVPF